MKVLADLGVAAEIVDGVMPMHKNNVQGAMLGAAGFDWKASGSTILPGAICEHFTSYGGIMSSKSEQTPLSEFLRYGAAGASGTVTEPFALPQNSPLQISKSIMPKAARWPSPSTSRSSTPTSCSSWATRSAGPGPISRKLASPACRPVPPRRGR